MEKGCAAGTMRVLGCWIWRWWTGGGLRAFLRARAVVLGPGRAGAGVVGGSLRMRWARSWAIPGIGARPPFNRKPGGSSHELPT